MFLSCVSLQKDKQNIVKPKAMYLKPSQTMIFRILFVPPHVFANPQRLNFPEISGWNNNISAVPSL